MWRRPARNVPCNHAYIIPVSDPAVWLCVLQQGLRGGGGGCVHMHVAYFSTRVHAHGYDM